MESKNQCVNEQESHSLTDISIVHVRSRISIELSQVTSNTIRLRGLSFSLLCGRFDLTSPQLPAHLCRVVTRPKSMDRDSCLSRILVAISRKTHITPTQRKTHSTELVRRKSVDYSVSALFIRGVFISVGLVWVRPSRTLWQWLAGLSQWKPELGDMRSSCARLQNTQGWYRQVCGYHIPPRKSITRPGISESSKITSSAACSQQPASSQVWPLQK